jgi:predicted Rossmann fold flavoprotein
MKAVSRYDLIIVGAGACGLMTAGIAGKNGKKVLVLEKNPEAGKKLLITGGGRCNYTNLQVTAHDYVSSNRHFCKSILSRWTPKDTISYFQNLGIHPQFEPDGKVFTASSSAKKLRDALVSYAQKQHVEFSYNTTVEDIQKKK